MPAILLGAPETEKKMFRELLLLTCLSLMATEATFVLQESHRKNYQHL